MPSTFADLGIPFPLYEAPVAASDDSDYAGTGSCCICGAKGAHCFQLGIGTAVMLPCPACNAMNGLDVDDKRNVECRSCGGPISYPSQVAAKREPKACYNCLRGGRAALTKDTEFGMVSWEQAFAGVSGGVPGLEQDLFEQVPVDDDDDEWFGVRLPKEIMFELLRTPTYGTWQGERWLFCCRQPMTFLGEWQREQFDARAIDSDGESLYYETLEDSPEDTWDWLGERLCAYVFQCKLCQKLRGHYDMD